MSFNSRIMEHLLPFTKEKHHKMADGMPIASMPTQKRRVCAVTPAVAGVSLMVGVLMAAMSLATFGALLTPAPAEASVYSSITTTYVSPSPTWWLSNSGGFTDSYTVSGQHFLAGKTYAIWVDKYRSGVWKETSALLGVIPSNGSFSINFPQEFGLSWGDMPGPGYDVVTFRYVDPSALTTDFMPDRPDQATVPDLTYNVWAKLW